MNSVNAESVHMENKKGRIYMLTGIFAMLLFMAADWILDVKGAGNKEIGVVVNSNWTNMSIWRFEASILLASIAMPFYWVGIKYYKSMIDTLCENGNKLSKIMGKLFSFSSISGVISFLFMHVMCCLFPIIFKIIFERFQDVQMAADMTNDIASYILVPFAVYYLVSDLGISIAMIYFVIKRKISNHFIAVCCNPVGGLILAVLFGLVPIVFIQDLKVAFESLGYVLMFIVGYLHLKNTKNE